MITQHAPTKDYYERMIQHYVGLEAVYEATGNTALLKSTQTKRLKLEEEYNERFGEKQS